MENVNLNKKSNIGIIIQARICSTRLPNKILKPFHNNNTILSILLNKLLKCNIPVIVATTINSKDDVICSYCEKNNIKYYRGSEENVLERFIKTAIMFNINTIIRVCSDNPFIDEKYINNLIHNYNIFNVKPDYYSYKLDGNKPIIKEHIGTFTELVSLKALQFVIANTKNKLYYEHVTNYIYENKHQFNIILDNTPDYIHNYNLKLSLRLTVDTIKDFNLLQELYISIYNKYGSNFTLKNTIEYLNQNKDKYINNMKLLIKNNPK